MPRPKGSKNNPKVPEIELAKVIGLYERQGRKFPYFDKDQVATGNAQDAPARSTDSDTLRFEIGGDNSAQPQANEKYECGACGAELPGLMDGCPHCGAVFGGWQHDND